MTPTAPPGTPFRIPVALLTCLFTVEKSWNTRVARTGVEPVTDRCLAGIPALTGRKIATT